MIKKIFKAGKSWRPVTYVIEEYNDNNELIKTINLTTKDLSEKGLTKTNFMRLLNNLGKPRKNGKVSTEGFRLYEDNPEEFDKRYQAWIIKNF